MNDDDLADVLHPCDMNLYETVVKKKGFGLLNDTWSQ